MAMVQIVREQLEEHMWCEDCGKPVSVEELTEYEDGFVFYHELKCNECGGDQLVGIKTCACGNEMSENDEFCSNCYYDLNQALTEFRDDHRLSQDQLEEIVANFFGW